MDGPSREVHVGGRRINVRLSKQEFDLLLCLYQKAGQTCSREELCGAVWGSVEVGGNAVPRADEHMLHGVVHRLRGKLARAGVDLGLYLTSVAGVGYRLDTTPREAGGAPADEPVKRNGLRRPVLVLAGVAAVIGIGIAGILLALGGIGDEGDEGGVTPSAAVGDLCGAEMISPEPGSTLPGPEATFKWTPGCGMIKYDLWVGCSPGDNRLFDADDGNFLEATADGLPTDGGPVYVWLVSSNGTEEGFFREKIEYTAAGGDGATVVLVPGDTVWLDTGVDIGPEETAAIEACGQVIASSAGAPQAFPAGDDDCPGIPFRPYYPYPDLPCWALVGRLGAGGEPFLVGRENTISTTGTLERLFLGINDDNLVDNSGLYRVTIRVTKTP